MMGWFTEKGRLLLLEVLWLTLTKALNTCMTTHSTGQTIANCSSLTFKHIPWDLHQDIQILDMGYNELTVISANSFVKYSPLHRLLLDNNNIINIHPEAFNRLSNLLKLDLSGNDLKVVPTEALQNLPNLVQLWLRGNSITHIENNAFVGVPSLKLLHLEGNYLRYIEPNAFLGLSSLQNMELQNNAIQSLEDGVFQYFNYHLLTIRLYNNPWFCDCRIRWLKIWLKNMTDLYKTRWQFPSLEPTCDGPSLVNHKKFEDIEEDYFACPVEMYTSGSHLSTKKDETVQMYCKYFSIPESGAVWYKNNEKLTIFKSDKKYSITESGTVTRDNILEIKHFEYEDIGVYKCEVNNILGTDSISYTVTLEGIDPGSITPAAALLDKNDSAVDIKSIIIAVSVIGGLLLITLIVGVLICGTGRWKRHRRQQKQQIVLQVKEHFDTNGDMSKSIDNTDSHSSDSNHNKDVSDPQESGFVSNSVSNIYQHPTSTNGNTYISFGSELSDPEDISQMYSTFRSQRPTGSHTGSTTPLLENHTSSFIEPEEVYIESPRVYSLQCMPKGRSHYYLSNGHIPRTIGPNRSTQIYRDPYRDYREYQDYCDYRDPYREEQDYRDYQDYRDQHEYRDPRETRFNRDYQDFRELQYPATRTLPHPQHVLNSKKSVSVGNLQYGGNGPRKPPRVHRTPEHVLGSECDTSSEIEQVLDRAERPSYVVDRPGFLGITPGTPV